MKIAKNFTLGEFTWSATAQEKGIDNTPNELEIENIKFLASKLQLVRDFVGKPITISSGYRCEALNKAVGGVAHSAHRAGLAVDIVCNGVSNRELAIAVISSIGDYDQVILERNSKGVEWVHIGVNRPNRNEVLTYRNKHFLKGLMS